MTLRFSPAAFMLAYCLAYVVAVAADLPAFRYYPLTGHLNWGPGAVKGAGPGMAWYGVMAEAGLAGLVAAVVLPDRWLQRPFWNVLWIIPVGALAALVFLMRIFFL